MSARQPNLIQALRGVLRTPVPPEHRLDLAFGWLVLVLFLVQLVTGILLALYYSPSPTAVAQSVEYIMRDVRWGWLIRGLHHWTSHALIFVILLQLLRLFLPGAYRAARAASWYVAVLLLGLVVVSTFTGEILAWDNDAYWLMVAMLRQVESIPLVGGTLATVLRGGDEVTPTTLGRDYAAHLLVLPWLAWLLLFLNQWFLARFVRRGEGGAR